MQFKILSYFLLLLIAVTSEADYPLKTKTSKLEYLGKPKNIRIYFKCEFDDIESIYSREYDQDGRLIEIKNISKGEGKKFANLEPENTVKYTYQGSEISTIDVKTDTNLGVTTSFYMEVLKRDSLNRPILSTSIYGMESTDKKDRFISDNQVEQTVSDWVSGSKKTLHSYKYVNNLVVEKQSGRGPFGEIISTNKVFEFREDGREISEMIEDSETKRLDVISENFYENNLIVKKINKSGRVDNEYYNDGTLRKISHYNGLDLFVISYEYENLEIDSSGNWKESIVTVIDSTDLLNDEMEKSLKSSMSIRKKSNCPKVRVTRDIEYFDQLAVSEHDFK
jgi:hypothetical protein